MLYLLGRGLLFVAAYTQLFNNTTLWRVCIARLAGGARKRGPVSVIAMVLQISAIEPRNEASPRNEKGAPLEAMCISL